MTEKIRRFVESHRFQNTIIALIIINAIILGMETSATLRASFGVWLTSIDGFILYIFILEIALKLFVYRGRFFTSAWNLFDFIIVAIALIPAGQAFAALRALRVLRVLRLISVVPAMRRVIEGFLSAIPGIASVAMIMVLFFYVFAVIGTHLYGETFPEWFGSIGKTLFTLFQIMTLESWSMGIVRPVMEEHPGAWAFFVFYILVTTFTMLNLFIAVMVDAIQKGDEEEEEESRNEIKDALTLEIKDMEKRILKELRKK